MGYAVLHMEKAGGSDNGMSAHIERTIAPKNADANRTHLNREMVTFPDGVSNRTEAIQHRLETAGLQRKIGKNQVRAIRILLTGSPDDMKRIEQGGNLDKWCNDNLDWLYKTYGAKNIVSAVLHLDETTPHIHATMIPIVTGERRKTKTEQAKAKRKYRKKSTDTARLCADDVMSRVRLKEYQNSYAEQMARYGLQRGVDGSEAKHASASQYYRDLLTQTESVQVNISQLLEQKEQAEQELSSAKADIKKEKLKNSAADISSKLIDGISSLLGTPKVAKTEIENKKLKTAIQQLYNENKTIRQEVEAIQSKALGEIENLKKEYDVELENTKKHYIQREEKFINENSGLKQCLSNLFQWLPIAQEILQMEKICKVIGFTAEQVSKLLTGKSLFFSGSLYSEEHKRRFNTDNSTAKIAQDSEAKKLFLVVDGSHITDWFKQKHEDLSIRLSRSRNTDKEKGLRI